MSYINNFQGSNYKTPSVVGTVYQLLNLINPEIFEEVGESSYYTGDRISVENSSGTTYYKVNGVGEIIGDNAFTIQPGENKITYKFQLHRIFPSSAATTYETSTFTIYGVENKFPLKPWTNEEVINRVLQLAEPLRKGETPRFSLSSIGQGVSKEDLQALAPEYTFTRMNLREVMQTIGGTMHAEPRLDINIDENYTGYWRFEKYGGTNLAEYKNFKTGEIKPLNQYKYTTYKRNHDIEQACTKLDSYMDNLVNRVDWRNATISKPSEYVWFGSRLRSETAYIRIEENSEETFFTTEFPIDTIESVEAVWRTKDENNIITGFNSVDITPYVYEKQVYNNLSSYSDTNPAKAYALYYTQGEKGIKGFFYKVPNATGGVYNNYSIVNVLEAAKYPLNQLEDSEYDGYNYMLLELRVKYVPIYSTRIQHGKQYLEDYLPTGRTINYAQGDNSVETRFFGENIKGVAQRLGTVEKYVTFILRHTSNIPKAGDLWDEDYYIATIQISVLQDHFEITCGLSKHFNRKSKYIGADSHKRIFEVSETMVQQRHTCLSDYIVIETKDTALHTTVEDYAQNVEDYGKQFLAPYAFDRWTALFDYQVRGERLDGGYEVYALNNQSKAQNVNIRGFTYNNSPVQQYSITIPVINSAFGNVIEFTCECKDNFSAGVSARRIEINGNVNYFTEEVEYGDYYGRTYYLDYRLTNDSLINLQDALSDASAFLPRENRWTVGNDYATTWNFRGEGTIPLLYRKDSREALRMSYLLETVAGDSSIIIGSALQRNNPIITNERSQKPHLYALTRLLGKFEDYIDTTAEDVTDYGEIGLLDNLFIDRDLTTYETFAKTNNLPLYHGDTTALSWCIAIPSYSGEAVTVENEDGTKEEYTPKLGGEILIARNEELQYGFSFGQLYVYCVHDIQKYIMAKKKAGKL